jgi:hypothetical protein
MGAPDQSRTKRRRTLWLSFTIGLAISLLGAIILFNPTLEFAVADLIEKRGLPIGLIGNIALIGDSALFAISVLGLIAMSVRAFFWSQPRT